MKHIIFPALLMLSVALPAAADAENINCNIRPGKQLSDSELSALSKVTQAEAEKAALAKVDVPSATVQKSRLSVEKECLVYLFDIKVPDKSGVEEVWVDAGTGEVLVQRHESATKQMLENTKDKILNKE